MHLKKINKKNWLLIIGFLLILFGIYLIIYHFISNKQITKLEEEAIKQFYIQEEKIINKEDSTNSPKENKEVKEQNKIEYIAVLKIPKINLVRGLVDPNSYLNNISYNVEILDNSDMPDKKNGNVILAAHAGNARISFFKNLNKLIIGDKITIDYKGKTYNYKVISIYDIEKTGTAKIVRNKDTSTLTLVTCRHNTNRQIIVICEIEK